MKIIFSFLFIIFWTSTPFAANQHLTDALNAGDYEKAYHFAKILAEGGDPHAQMILGLMYKEGQSVPKDYSKAMHWLNNAAEQGQTLAQYSLGLMYEEGTGINKNLLQAYVWFQIAAGNGHYGAQKKAQFIKQKLNEDQVQKAHNMTKLWLTNRK